MTLFTPAQRKELAGDGMPCLNNHDPDCRWPKCNCRELAQNLNAKEADEKQELLRQLYQIVGSMLSDMGLFESERGQKLLDNIYAERVLHDDLLPWPSFEDKVVDATRAYLKGLQQGSEQERERIAQEFDRRAIYIGGTPSEGFYEPTEPAQIVRNMP